MYISFYTNIYFLLQLLEPNVVIRVREVDQSLVESILSAASSKYKDLTGKDIVLKVDTESYLPPDVTGGIELQAHKGRIKITNTLEARLELIAQQLIPEIRSALFGKNPNRKFVD